MLWAWWNVQALIGVSIACIIADIEWIAIVDHRVSGIDVDATGGIDDLYETLQAHPGVVIDVYTEIIENSILGQAGGVAYTLAYAIAADAMHKDLVELILTASI